MNTKDKKISIAEHNLILADVINAHAEFQTCKALLAKAEGFEVLPNCPTCKGAMEVEDGYGNLNHNPSMNMRHVECPDCKGFGYVDKPTKT